MKLFVCVLLISCAWAQSLTDEQKANWRKWSEECRQETGVSQEAITQVRNNQFDLVTDPKIYAHSFCFAKKSGLADSNGELQVDVFKARLERVTTAEEAERILSKCNVKKSTPEQTLYNTFKCVRENRPKFSPVK